MKSKVGDDWFGRREWVGVCRPEHDRELGRKTRKVRGSLV